MGLADRDYARHRDHEGDGPGHGRTLGAPRVWSFNTWLIVINVAVFVLNSMVLSQPGALRQFPYGTVFDDNTTYEEQKRAVRGSSDLRQYPGIPNVYYYPLVDPMVPATRWREIGRERRVFMPVLTGIGHFSTTQGFRGLEVWRFITFQFLHQNATHLLLNMMGLFFVGPLVEQFLGTKRYAAFYLACGIFGAVAYLILNLLGYFFKLNLPFLLFHDPSTPLVGASAGIFGVLMAAAFISPREEVYLAGIIPVQLRVAVYMFATVAVLNLFAGTNNAGGEAAHVGGALAGYYLIRHTHLLRDFFDITGDSRRSPRKLRVRYDAPDRAEVDRILAKIGHSGMDSLTEAERTTLRADTQAKRAAKEGA